eukprot:scaffold225_cov194-Ochromonas_danica.AAC.1
MKANRWVSNDEDFLQHAQACNNRTLEAFLSSCSSSSSSSSSSLPLIPRIVHFIWIGSNPLPAYSQTVIQRFQVVHPSWEVKYWDDDQVAKLCWQSENCDIFYQVTNPG